MINYERQAQLNLDISYDVIMVGCGGVGAWASIFLALAGVSRMHLFDPDVITDHNLNRLPYPETAAGTHKVHALQEYIENIRPVCNVYAYPSRFDANLSYVDNARRAVVVCTVDNHDSYIEAYEYAKQHGLPFYRLAASAKSVTVAKEPAPFDGGDRTNGYEGIQIYVTPVALVAALGVDAILHNCSFTGVTHEIANLT